MNAGISKVDHYLRLTQVTDEFCDEPLWIMKGTCTWVYVAMSLVKFAQQVIYEIEEI